MAMAHGWKRGVTPELLASIARDNPRVNWRLFWIRIGHIARPLAMVDRASRMLRRYYKRED